MILTHVIMKIIENGYSQMNLNSFVKNMKRDKRCINNFQKYVKGNPEAEHKRKVNALKATTTKEFAEQHRQIVNDLYKDEEFRKKQQEGAKRNAQDLEWRKQQSISHLESMNRPETKQKLKEYSLWQQEHDEEYRKARGITSIRCVETNAVYFSVTEAQRQTGISSMDITLVADNNGRKTAGGYHWEWAEERKRCVIKGGNFNKERVNAKKVRCIETGIIYNSFAEAERETGTNSISISFCCKGRSKTANKLHWEFVK